MGADDRSSRRSRLQVAVSDERGRPLSAGLSRWLARVAPVRARGMVNIAVVSDHQVRALNRRYRGIDRATDVLSFKATDSPQKSQKTQKSKAISRSARSAGSAVETFLGDIVIARGVARRQARAAGHGDATEIRVLALHGLLHLLGYDHDRDNGAMARVERRLRRKGGLRSGLIERQ